jgi:hypothetical protein
MGRLDDYRTALLAAWPETPDAALVGALTAGGGGLASFVIDHGLGPLWHARTARDELRESRLSAEALYLAQERALNEIDAVLSESAIEYAVIKGGANRLLLYENPALRSCHDIDLLVRKQDRVRAASALVAAGFAAHPKSRSISRELVLSQGVVDIDLHWGLLREGRLRFDLTAEMLDRRRRSNDLWMLNAEDALFLLLVHPAFAKHLAGWDMGLHRVVDIVVWLREQPFDWSTVLTNLKRSGVGSAAWATLRWVQLLTSPNELPRLDTMLSDLEPGALRRTWLNRWLENDLSARTSRVHWARLIGLSPFLHDSLRDSVRALAGRRRAQQRSADDLEAFRDVGG